MKVKNGLTGLFILMSLYSFGQQQEINQHDARGRRNGIWKKYYDNGDQLRYSGRFNHGREVGTFKFYKPGNSAHPAATKTYRPNNDTVVMKFFTAKGNLKATGKLLHKKREGAWHYYHKKKLMMTEHYKNGKLDGWKIIYYPNGHITAKKKFKNGMKNGNILIYAKNGQLLQQYHYRNDTLNGKSKVYDKEGHLLSEGRYKKGLRDGPWKFYTQGKLDSIQKYPLKKRVKNIPTKNKEE